MCQVNFKLSFRNFAKKLDVYVVLQLDGILGVRHPPTTHFIRPTRSGRSIAVTTPLMRGAFPPWGGLRGAVTAWAMPVGLVPGGY